MRPYRKDPSPPRDRIWVAHSDPATILIRVKGLGNMLGALGLADFVQGELDRGICRFAVDLAGCEGMDSTFMGTLVGIAQNARERPGGWVCMLNVSEANRELLGIVGADRFFVFDSEHAVAADLVMQPLPALETLPQRRLELVRRAHENLVDIDRRNAAKFGAILRSMTAELDRKASESDVFEGLGDGHS